MVNVRDWTTQQAKLFADLKIYKRVKPWGLFGDTRVKHLPEQCRMWNRRHYDS